jgi:hypothetical protein
MMLLNSVREYFLAMDNAFLRTAFSSASYTQGGVSDRSSRNSTLGYLLSALQADENPFVKLRVFVTLWLFPFCHQGSKSRSFTNLFLIIA